MFGKFCLRVAVGIGLFLLFGGSDAAGMLAMAVVCTAGVGLIVVIPAAYLIGLICTIWFIPFGSGQEKTPGFKTSKPINAPSTVSGKLHSIRELNSLLAFVLAADAKGRDWISIRDELLGAGWDAETVERIRIRAEIAHPRK